MNIENVSIVLIVGLVLTGLTLFKILVDHTNSSNRDFAALGLFCSALMLISYYIELNAPTFEEKIMAIKFGYIGKAFVNPMLLMLVVRYYDLRIPKSAQAFLYVIPLLTVTLVFNCDKSSFYYSRIALDRDGLIQTSPGIFYFVYMGYNVVLSMLYLTLCLYKRKELTTRQSRITNIWLIMANLIPLCMMLVYLAGWTGGFDSGPCGAMCGALIMAVPFFRYGFLDKEEILQKMRTALIFLDSDNNLAYANQSAKRLLPVLSNTKHAQKLDFSALTSDKFASIQIGSSTYQRKIDDWSAGDGQHGKLITFDDITEIRARLNRDAMTGLLNHATFYPMLDDALAKSRKNSVPVTVSLADIDSFKRINDTFGHANGDIVLIELAKTLENICGGHGGNAFRYGGEEFAVIFECNETEAESIMQQALDSFSAIRFDFLDRAVTFSFGSAEYDGSESSVTLFERADQLMYRRKRALHARERAEAEANGIDIPIDSRI